MSVISYLSTQVGRIAQSFRATRTAFARVFNFSSTEVYPNINVKTAIEKGFNSNAAVYSIIMKDAKKFASIPRYLYNAKEYEEKTAKKRPPTGINKILWESKAYSPFEETRKSELAPTLTDLLNRPNEYLSQDLFFEGIRCYYKTCGEAMIWLNRGDLDRFRNEDGSLRDNEIDKEPILEMYVLPVDMVTILPDPENLWGILAYVLEVNKRIHIRKNDVIHWKSTNLNFNPDSRDHLRGLPPLTPGKKTLTANNSMTDSAVRMTQNDGAKYVIYNEDKTQMSPQQQSDLKKVIDAKINNNDVKGSVATLQGKWGGIDLGKSSVDMQLLEGKKFTWQELCFLFDVPYEFFDSQTTFANKEMAMVHFITNAIEPATKQLDGEMNRVLLKAFDLEGKAFIACDYTGLPEMKKIAAESARTLKETGVVTKNEIRESLGYEKSDNPLMDEVWVSSSEMPISEVSTASGEPDDDLLLQLEQNYGKVGANGNGN